MKFEVEYYPPPGLGRSPYGERGLKFLTPSNVSNIFALLPVWGAWIEILMTTAFFLAFPSLPVWGAWIEIPETRRAWLEVKASLPTWGAWIEMISSLSEWSKGTSRFPHREWGLKY